MKSKKPLIIIFEGVDKSGKTTLKDLFNKITNFKYVVFDRFTTSSKVYNYMFNRDFYEYYDKVEKTLIENFEVIIFYCTCSGKTINYRLAKANESLPEELDDIFNVKRRFMIELEKTNNSSSVHLKVLDTGIIGKTIDDCVNDALQFINEVKEMLDDNVSN